MDTAVNIVPVILINIKRINMSSKKEMAYRQSTLGKIKDKNLLHHNNTLTGE